MSQLKQESPERYALERVKERELELVLRPTVTPARPPPMVLPVEIAKLRAARVAALVIACLECILGSIPLLTPFDWWLPLGVKPASIYLVAFLILMTLIGIILTRTAYAREGAIILLGSAVAFLELAYLGYYYEVLYPSDGLMKWAFLALGIADLYLALQTLYLKRYAIMRRAQAVTTDFV